MGRTLFIFFFLSFSFLCAAQEICDNAIDDDGDGLIDLNDEECECSKLLPSSLIPNPSFEERTCCPTQNARLDCAVGWIQASNPTTDYIHTCGNYLGNTNIPAFVPLPLPDGQGAVGFRDGQKNVGSNYKEYVGACLKEPMEVGVSYSLDFFVGFRDNVLGNKSLDIAIFGSTDCNQLPFGNGSYSVGCPANTQFYDEIDIQSVSGSNEWVRVTFEFTPTKPYEVMIIGPSCPANPNYIYDPYFYLDGLTLAETSKFGLPFEDIAGSICNDDLVLSIDDEAGQSFQWYKDGVALVGEVYSELHLMTSSDVEGEYLVVVTLPTGCIASKSYNVRVPPYYAEQEVTICESEDHIIGETSFEDEGTHEITITAHDGCDSIVTLTLHVNKNSAARLEDYYCEGETFSLFDIVTDSPGIFETILPNHIGCDSIITVEVTEIPETDGVELPYEVIVKLGDSIDIFPSNYDPNLIQFYWHDKEGEVISNSLNIQGLKPVENTTLYLVGTDQYGCSIEQEVLFKIDDSSVIIHLPNVFSPDGNRVNDFFSYFPTKAVESIETFQIYDRWGNKVYIANPNTDFHNHLGWDGTYNGKSAAQGVYTYMLKAKFINGTEKIFSGNLTLLRP